LYEAKLFHQSDPRFATFDDVSNDDLRKGNARSMTSKEKSDPRSVALPRYWVPEDEVLNRIDKRGLILESADGQAAKPVDILAELARNSLFGHPRKPPRGVQEPS